MPTQEEEIAALKGRIAELEQQAQEANDTFSWLFDVDDSIGEIGQRLRRRLGRVEHPQHVERVRVGDKVVKRIRREASRQ